jgi:hypothetical protein
MLLELRAVQCLRPDDHRSATSAVFVVPLKGAGVACEDLTAAANFGSCDPRYRQSFGCNYQDDLPDNAQANL